MIAPSTIERVKELSVVQVIGHYVDLKPNGPNFRGLSPFTNEKTPSFYVVPRKNIFKDFSSGKGGDAIRFVMEFEKCDFVEAIKSICQKTGEKLEWEISEKANEDQSQREELFRINRAAAKRYAETLLEIGGTHWAFKELINKRVFSPDTILQWQIGYAPSLPGKTGYEAWQFLTSILREKALIQPAVDLGLVKEKDGRNYDAFRERIMFPVHDHLGRIVGFGGRAEKEDKYNAKYINSSESKIFDKKSVLFGLHFAGGAIRQSKFANLMEGYSDVISFHQAGYTNTVGTCGTSLTSEQCRLLKKYCNKVVQFPDPDNAGENAAIRNIDLLMAEGFEVAVVPMPKVEGKKIDPDELTRMFQIQHT